MSGKKSRMKNIIFSWRNLDLKIAKIFGNPLKSNMLRFGGGALHMKPSPTKSQNLQISTKIIDFQSRFSPRKNIFFENGFFLLEDLVV